MSPDIHGTPTLDQVQLSELHNSCGHDLALVAEVLELYLHDSKQIIPMLRWAAETADPDALGELAHKLRGSSSYVGALRMVELCKTLEESSNAGVNDGAPGLVDQIDSEFKKITDAIWLELKSATA